MGITKALWDYVGKMDSKFNTGHVLLGPVDKETKEVLKQEEFWGFFWGLFAFFGGFVFC